jgi:hypothetical protein
VDQLGPANLSPPDLLGEVGEVSREYRRPPHHPAAEFPEKRQYQCLLESEPGNILQKKF